MNNFLDVLLSNKIVVISPVRFCFRIVMEHMFEQFLRESVMKV